jgi:hypothetical protein
MALKSDKVIPITTLKAKPRCGDCLHFKHISKFERVCSTLGVKQFAEAPTCFSPNVYALTKKNPDILHQLGMLLREFTPAETRVFMALLRQKVSMDKNYGLAFGQPVMFRIGGGDYLSNYFKGYVIGVASVGDGQVFVASDMSKTQRNMPATATLLPSSVYPLSKWKKKKAELVKDKKLKDPNPLYSPTALKKEELTIDYKVPTLEDAPSAWFDKTDGGGKLKSKKKLKQGKDGSVEFNVER